MDNYCLQIPNREVGKQYSSLSFVDTCVIDWFLSVLILWIKEFMVAAEKVMSLFTYFKYRVTKLRCPSSRCCLCVRKLFPIICTSVDSVKTKNGIICRPKMIM